MESLFSGLIAALPDTVHPRAVSENVVFIDEQDPVLFWNKFTGAIHANRSIVLMDPSWPDEWKKHYFDLCSNRPLPKGVNILVPTSGTTEKPKFCIHTIESISTAARMFADRFSGQGMINCVNVLPQHHVGGLMPVLRSAAMGGRVLFSDYRNIGSAAFQIDPDQAAISLVPTQLKRMLESNNGPQSLRRFGMILIGGAACPQPLLDHCRQEGLKLAPCYGSSETAALVTVLDPTDFIEGNNSAGKPLPGVVISIGDDQRIQIMSDSLQSGYLPAQKDFTRDPFQTSDLGELDAKGFLHVIGRTDRVIITGGKKVIPEQVERITFNTGLVEDVWCYGIPDSDWGNQVQMDFIPAAGSENSKDALHQFLNDQLPSYAVPKKLNRVNYISRNHMGKKSH